MLRPTVILLKIPNGRDTLFYPFPYRVFIICAHVYLKMALVVSAFQTIKVYIYSILVGPYIIT